MSSIGFIGPIEQELSVPQYDNIKNILSQLKERHLCDIIYLGDSRGADEQVFQLAKAFGYYTVVSPVTLKQQNANIPADKRYRPISVVLRNRSIVIQSNILIVAPIEQESVLHSKPWAMSRFAKKQNKQLIILLPDGQVKQS